MTYLRCKVLALLLMLAATAPAQVNPSLLSGLRWRSIGPAMFGGRLTDVAGVPGNPHILYIAHSTAGLFKSTNGGVTWDSIFNDGNTLSIGAFALAPDNPDVIYVGTGEGNPRNSTSFGDGIYKSLDGGRTWKNLALKDSERFSRIIVDPKDPRIVFAAAMGHEWGANQERGLYRSNDAGATWKRASYVNDTTGAADACFDSADPNIVYAAMYDYLRKPWNLRSGGPGSGLYRSSDGGETWTKLTDPKLNNGLPGAKSIGRIGIAVAPSNANVVYAVIQAQEPGILWRSDDRGLHWRVVNSERQINQRPFYFSKVTVDSADENRVYSVSRSLYISEDGGRTFRAVDYNSMFGDNHVTWVDPKNPNRVLAGSDGGFFMSNDRGAHWDFFNNIPMGQAYHVGVDMADPYNVMAGFQDHEIWRGPNERWNQAGVREGDWHRMRATADGMYAIPDPRDPNILYFNGEQGDLTRFDVRTQEERYIEPYPIGPIGAGANMQKYRFNWNAAVHMSPTNPDVIYHGANVLFRSADQGSTWSIISPDLTTNDPEKQKLSGGAIDPDNSHAEYYCTITAISENPRDPKLIWVGTDDGNVQITRDGGAHWTNVIRNIQGAPANGWVPSIHASPSEPGTAYVAIDQHRLDDFKPYAFMTTDYGRTWKNIAAGLNGYVHIIMEDPKSPNLLYAGTELGIFLSFDRGAHWTDFRLGLPRLPVVDMVVHPRDNDLIIATHARGFYSLDDVTPLQELARNLDKKIALFKPMRATRYFPISDVSSLGNRVWVARNKPYGATISYYLQTPAQGRVELAILDQNGSTLQTLSGPGSAGINRAAWNLRQVGCAAGPTPPRPGGRGGAEGTRAMPGDYKVRLTALGETAEQTLTVRVDPRVQVSAADLGAYQDTVTRLVNMQCSIDQAMARITSLNRQLSDERIPANLHSQAAQLKTGLQAIGVDLSPDPRDPEHLNLRGKIAWMSTQVQNYTGRPTQVQLEYTANFEQQLQPLLQRLDAAIKGDLTKLNQSLRAANLPEITP